jgi:hypothetical protein
MQLIAVPAAGLHFQRLLRIILGRLEDERAGINRNLVAVSTEEFVQGQAGDLARDVPEADIEGPVGIDGNVIPPAIVRTKLLPELLAKQGILSCKKRLQG